MEKAFFGGKVGRLSETARDEHRLIRRSFRKTASHSLPRSLLSALFYEIFVRSIECADVVCKLKYTIDEDARGGKEGI